MPCHQQSESCPGPAPLTRDAELVMLILHHLRYVADPATQQIAIFAAGELGPMGTLFDDELTQLQRLSLTLRGPAKAAQKQIASEAETRALR